MTDEDELRLSGMADIDGLGETLVDLQEDYKLLGITDRYE